MIKIITDSSCDLPQELIDKYNVDILPLRINLGEKSYADRTDITPEQIFAWADEHKDTPKTSVFSIDTAINWFEKYPEDELICFSISTEMSSSLNVMRLAMLDVEGEDRIHLIDSRNLSAGIGLLVCAAGEMIAQGMPIQDIVDEINALIPKVRSSFVVDTLTYLHRGGRCSGAAALSGNMLKIHPKIIVRDGKMVVDKKYRGKMSNILMSYCEDLKPELSNAQNKNVFIVYTGDCDEIAEQLKEKLDMFENVYIVRACSVISSHCGPGTLGILYIEK